MWRVGPDGRVYLDLGNTDDLAATQAKLAAVTAAHAALLAQVRALEDAIAAAGMAITQAEP